MTNPSQSATLVYVGTYTGKGSKGIYTYGFDPDTGTLDLRGSVEADNPSFLAIRPDKSTLYAVNETGEFRGEPTGAVSAFAIDPDTGLLTLLNQQPSHGTSPAHITVDPEGKQVFVANYGSGTAAVFPVLDDGGIGAATDVVQHEGSGPNQWRQREPHAHSVNLDPGGHRLYVADLGIDKLHDLRR